MSTLKLIATAVYLMLWPALVLIIGGDLRWIAGWLFSAWFVVSFSRTVLWMYQSNPGLLSERYRRPGTGGQSHGDQLLVSVLMVAFIAWIIAMPLDAKRYSWTPPLPLAVRIAGGLLLVLSSQLIHRSFVDNSFASPLVRVQAERGHQVVTTGVYRAVRHPMYLGAILMFVGAPLLIGSTVALALSVVLTLVLVVRVVNEEAALSNALAEYDDYRRRVRYRIIPFVW